jgi:hypothetical protein
MFWLGLIVGFFLGVTLGVFTVGLLTASKTEFPCDRRVREFPTDVRPRSEAGKANHYHYS